MTVQETTMVAIDVAKLQHFALILTASGMKEKLRFDNSLQGFNLFFDRIQNEPNIQVALEPTGDYHRCLCYFLHTKKIQVQLVSTLAVARTREAEYNSWDKNDPKDAQVILTLLQRKITQYYYDPFVHQTSDIRELAKNHFTLGLQKTKIQHTLINHFLTLYFPEAQAFFSGSKSLWFSGFLKHFPVPSSIVQMTLEEFISTSLDMLKHVPFRKDLLTQIYSLAQNSIGLPLKKDSREAQLFSQTLQDHALLNQRLRSMEKEFETTLQSHPQYKILRSVPGIGPVVALNILAITGDLSRFSHAKQFINFAGLNLSSSQSGKHQGNKKLSKRGNSRLRSIMWLATKAAIYANRQGNPFKKKFLSITSKAPNDGDLKRKALTACTIKMATIIHTLIKKESIFRPFEA